MSDASTARHLWSLWQAGDAVKALPPELRPATSEEGYAAQAGFEAFSNAPRAGWKIAATSVAGQRHINVDGPLAGRILDERVLRDGEKDSMRGNRMRVCEPEFAFRLGEDVAPRATRWTADDALGPIADLHPALELPDSRFEDFTTVGAPSLIADDACARDLVVGPPAPRGWRSLDLAAHDVRAVVSGGLVRRGVGSNVLGDPRAALAWLLNTVGGLGLVLRAGEIVTTGTCMVSFEIAPGDRVEADFGAIGLVSLRLAP